MKRFVFMAAALAMFAQTAEAQDVVELAHRHGSELPKWIRQELARDPNAFEFQFAWKSHLEDVRSTRVQLRSQGVDAQAMAPASAARAGAAVQGTFKVPVVTVLYSNTATAPYPVSGLQNRLYDGSGITLTSLYSEMSRGLLTLTGTVHEWSILSKSDTVYEGVDNGDKVGELLKEALEQVDRTVDFRQYDSDSDGFVDFVAFVHPEYGGECRDNKNIWSHRWNYGSATGTGQPFVTDDGVRIWDYVIQPALNCPDKDGNTSMIDIGVFAHEYGHAFGLPDLYATDYSNGGISVWGLMGSGSWNRPDSPSHMEAWSKAELGWVKVVTLTENRTGLRMEPVQSSGIVYRLDVANSPGEYFLLENRQKIGSDQHLINSGLLVWHVDSTVIARLRSRNQMNNESVRKGLELVEADGAYDMRSKDRITRAKLEGDPFPGTLGRTSLGATTTPSSFSHWGYDSKVALRNITEVNGVISLDATVGSTAAFSRAWGDVDRNGYITYTDAQLVLDRATGKSNLPPMEWALADVDGDGDVDATDAFIIQSYVASVDVSRFRVGKEASSASPMRGSR